MFFQEVVIKCTLRINSSTIMSHTHIHTNTLTEYSKSRRILLLGLKGGEGSSLQFQSILSLKLNERRHSKFSLRAYATILS